VSSLWTPDGERPVQPRAAAEGTDPSGPPPDDAELAAQMAAMRDELINSPVEVVIANHCYGLFELAAIYLSQSPPMLFQARLAIDGLGAVLDALQGRLGEAESSLRESLSQLRLVYVRLEEAERSAPEPSSDGGSKD
jgi:hypothetical protein